jgi:hypothetical protein
LEALQLKIYEKIMKSQNCETHNLGILRLPLGSFEVLETKKHFNVVFITRSKVYYRGGESWPPPKSMPYECSESKAKP